MKDALRPVRPIQSVAAVHTQAGRSMMYGVLKDRMTRANGLVASLAFAPARLADRPVEILRNAFSTEPYRRCDAPAARYRALAKSERFNAAGIGKDMVRLFLPEERFLPGPRVYRHGPFVLSSNLFHANSLAATTVR